MQRMFRFTGFVLIYSFIFFCTISYGGQLSFQKEYTYQAGDEDSKNSSRTIALREVKRLLLEEIGTYLESITEIRNFQLTKDQVTSLTAGIVKTEIINERWDGKTYYIKVNINTDPDEVVKSIDILRKDKEKTKELGDLKRINDELIRKNEELKKALSLASPDEKKRYKGKYEENIKAIGAVDWYEKGLSAGIAGQYGEAIYAFNKSIELDPNNAKFYYNRGVTFGKTGEFQKAIYDYSKTIEIDPKYVLAYINRGTIYGRINNTQHAINDFSKAIEIDPNNAIAYFNRGMMNGIINNLQDALRDFDKATQFDPQYKKAFYYRGYTYAKFGNFQNAIIDYSKVIELDPTDRDMYEKRALLYIRVGKHNLATEDFKNAARLGSEKAQNLLKMKGIQW